MFFINYKCYKCSYEWSEYYDTACDSECPKCEAKNNEAVDYEESK